jgi:hypothetical protein
MVPLNIFVNCTIPSICLRFEMIFLMRTFADEAWQESIKAFLHFWQMVLKTRIERYYPYKGHLLYSADAAPRWTKLNEN